MSELLLVKNGTGAFSNADRTKLDKETIEYVAEDVANLYCEIEGSEVDDGVMGGVIMVTSGAITAGREKLEALGSEQDFSQTRMQQVASMIGNKIICNMLEDITGRPVAPDTPTRNDLLGDEHVDNLVTAMFAALEVGALTVLNEGDARSTKELERKIKANGKEIKRFGDNDQLTALVGTGIARNLSQAARSNMHVFFLTDIEGVREDPNNEQSVLCELDAKDLNDVIMHSVSPDLGESNGGMLSKLLAAKDLAAFGVGSTIGYGKGEHALMRMYHGESGTRISV